MTFTIINFDVVTFELFHYARRFQYVGQVFSGHNVDPMCAQRAHNVAVIRGHSHVKGGGHDQSIRSAFLSQLSVSGWGRLQLGVALLYILVLLLK